MRVLVIIPAYNEADNLPPLIHKVRATCGECDFIVINDCSTDDTVKVCQDLDCKCIDLIANLGIGGTVQTGIKYAYENGYDIAIQVDGDGQHDPAYIPQMIEMIKDGANVCIGSRFLEKEGFQSTKARRAGILFFSKLLRLLTGETFTDPTSGFRAWDKKAIKCFNSDYPKDYPEPESIIMLARKGLKTKEIPVVMHSREHGRSSITFMKSIYYMIKVTLSLFIVRMTEKG